MADIPVNLVAQGNLKDEALKAAAGMKKLAAEEEKVAAVAKIMGKTTGEVKAGIKAQEAAVKAVEQEEKKRANAAMKALRDEEKLRKKQEKAELLAIKGMSKQEVARERAFKKELGDIRALLSGDITPLFEGLGSKAALPVALVTALGTAFVVAGAAALALLGTVGALALKAGVARDETKAMLDVLTGGRGVETMSLLDGLAKQLGVSISETRDKFIEFRKAGIDNSQSAALIKLRADLLATGMAAGEADEGIKKIIDQAKKADGSIDGKKFSEAFALIAKQAGVAGDGILAAEKNAKSFAGALNRLDNSKTIALEAIYDRIKPKIDEAASKVATFVENFMKSERGKAALDALANSITALVSGVIWAVEKTSALITAWDEFKKTETAKVILEGLKVTLYLVGGALALVAAGAIALIAPFVAAGAAVVAAIGLIWDAFKTLPANVSFVIGEVKAIFSDLVTSAVSFGTNIIQGLISGIKNATGALFSTVSGIASGVKNTFKSILGIASPSKEFEKLGMFTGKGLEIGLERSVPDSADIAGGMIPSAASATAGAGNASAPSTSIGDINISVNVAGTEASADDIAAAVRREVSMVLSGFGLSRGLPA